MDQIREGNWVTVLNEGEPFVFISYLLISLTNKLYELNFNLFPIAFTI